jgi:hypothetical protein
MLGGYSEQQQTTTHTYLMGIRVVVMIHNHASQEMKDSIPVC